MNICYVCKHEEDDDEYELRPYGPKGAYICFACMTSDPAREAEAHRQFTAALDACGPVAKLGGTEGPVPMLKEGKQ